MDNTKTASADRSGDLLGCPFCGCSEFVRHKAQDGGHSVDAETLKAISVDGSRSMVCMECGARGPETFAKDKQCSVAGWNIRASSHELPKVMVLAFEPALTHSVWRDYSHRRRTLRGLHNELREGVKSGRFVGYRLIRIERDVLGNEPNS